MICCLHELPVKGEHIISKMVITNRGKETAPIGFGLHPWFLLDHEPEKWTLQLRFTRMGTDTRANANRTADPLQIRRSPKESI